MSTKCQSSVDWESYDQACEEQQMSIEPTQFFGCNPCGNLAQIDFVQDSILSQQTSACDQQVVSKFQDANAVNQNNFTIGELAEWSRACLFGGIAGGVGGAFSSAGVGAIPGALLGCGFGVAMNEAGEDAEETIKAGIALYECSTESDGDSGE